MPPFQGKRGYPPPAGFEDFQYAQRQLKRGVTLTFIGFALLIGLGSIGPLAGISYVGPWLLGGLIPMFVGLAQVVSAILSGARFPGVNAGGYSGQQTTFAPPPPPPPGSAPPQPPTSPYAWRPGSTPEIEQKGPPDQR
jgi:hypothetical protein